jgi:hypothetical protein
MSPYWSCETRDSTDKVSASRTTLRPGHRSEELGSLSKVRAHHLICFFYADD